jgi:SAM-dependent methyltransferase
MEMIMSDDNPNIFLQNVSRYYSGTLSEHGATPKGVDWNGHESQRIRFEQLTKIIPTDTPFSINDIGCGYGALLDYLLENFPTFEYCGIDLTAAMVQAARNLHEATSTGTFEQGTLPSRGRDYSIASGIFSVCLDTPHAVWKEHINNTLSALDASSTKGFAFNCLTSYSDKDKMKPHLYYADPCDLFDLCKRRFSPQVTLLHDYGLYEFTILVRKRA